MATGDSVTINGRTWSNAPATAQFCDVLESRDLTDGGSVIVEGKPAAKFRYFEDMGIVILEKIPESQVQRMAIYFKAGSGKPKRDSPYKAYGNAFQRPPKEAFNGLLELNGRELRAPLPLSQFPTKGELTFVRNMAFGKNVTAFLAAGPEFVEYVLFEFKQKK